MKKTKIDGRLRCSHCKEVICESDLIWMYGKPYHENPGCTLSASPISAKPIDRV